MSHMLLAQATPLFYESTGEISGAFFITNRLQVRILLRYATPYKIISGKRSRPKGKNSPHIPGMTAEILLSRKSAGYSISCFIL